VIRVFEVGSALNRINLFHIDLGTRNTWAKFFSGEMNMKSLILLSNHISYFCPDFPWGPLIELLILDIQNSHCLLKQKSAIFSTTPSPLMGASLQLPHSPVSMSGNTPLVTILHGGSSHPLTVNPLVSHQLCHQSWVFLKVSPKYGIWMVPPLLLTPTIIAHSLFLLPVALMW
jgi:hypothetical protein